MIIGGRVFREIYSLEELTAKNAPENLPNPKRKPDRLPSITFQGRAVKLRVKNICPFPSESYFSIWLHATSGQKWWRRRWFGQPKPLQRGQFAYGNHLGQLVSDKQLTHLRNCSRHGGLLFWKEYLSLLLKTFGNATPKQSTLQSIEQTQDPFQVWFQSRVSLWLACWWRSIIGIPCEWQLNLGIRNRQIDLKSFYLPFLKK